MFKRLALGALAAVVAATAMTAAADAEVRLKRKHGVAYFEPYYPGEAEVAPGQYGYYVPPGAYDEPVYYDRQGRAVAFDDSYYAPYYLPPSKKSKKAKAAQRAKAKAAALADAREAEAKANAKKLVKAKTAPAASEEITGSTSKVKTVSTAPENTKKAVTATVSCDKATSIVSGYGFATVEATKCAAPTYEFRAKRDGKDFLIKVSSASGELTEVKKLN